MSNIKNIQKMLKGRLRENVSLKDYNTWKIGGKAEYFYEPSDIKDLKLFLELLQNTPVTFLGNGSNVLIRDGGINGCVICLKNTLNNYFVKDEEYIFEAGLSCMKMAQITARENYEGLEYLCGIPGSLGGALAMNAGCYGSETWDFISKVLLIDLNGNQFTRYKEEFDVGYRKVVNKKGLNEYFLGAWFVFPEGEKETAQTAIKDLLKNRKDTQPLEWPTAGSTFRNPPNNYAAKLIEDCDLKGHCIGGAQVSNKHANFIVNIGNATALDIERLIEHIKKRVLEVKNITLETEIRFIGEEFGP